MIKLEIVIDTSKQPFADVTSAELDPTPEDKAVASLCHRAIEVAFETIIKAHGDGVIISLDGFARDLRNRLDPPAS